MTTACFTGHRKFADTYYNRHNPSPEWHTLKSYMDLVVADLVAPPMNVDHFISGLAIGVDMLGAESVAYVRSFRKLQIKLTGAMPFPSQASKWPTPTRQHWEHVCSLCNDVIAVSQDPYHPAKMQTRNEWMVDNANFVIAVWNGIRSGGTWNCMNYALKQGKPILIVHQLGTEW